MEMHLDLNMTMIRPPDGLQQVQYLKEFGDIYKRLEKRLEPALVNQEQWKRDRTYLWHEDRIVVPADRIWALLRWTWWSRGSVPYPEAVQAVVPLYVDRRSTAETPSAHRGPMSVSVL